MTIHVFAGPTIERNAILSVVPEAIIHPPVQHGALFKLQSQPGDIVAIIDGNFFHMAAIRHKEILAIIEAGVRVYGAASMGALRAAELDVFGMHGVGVVYRLFASGVLSRDDEVAVAHADATAGWRPANLALVSLRFKVRRARSHGVIDSVTERHIIQAATELPFYDRTYNRIGETLATSGIPASAIDRAMQFLEADTSDIKRLDAERLLRRVSIDSKEPAPGGPFVFPQTVPVSSWRRQFTSTISGTEDDSVSDEDVLAACQIASRNYPQWSYKITLREFARSELGVNVQDRGITYELAEQVVQYVRRQGILPPDTQEISGPLTRWLTPAEQSAALTVSLPLAVVRCYQQVPGVYIRAPQLRELSGSEAAEVARGLIIDARKLNAELAAQSARYTLSRISLATMRAWLTSYWGFDFELSLANRGISGEDEFDRLARPLFPYAYLRGLPDIAMPGELR